MRISFDLEWDREDSGGNVYKGRFEIDGELQEMEGWLCPALNLYFPDVPKKLYVQVKEVKEDLPPDLHHQSQPPPADHLPVAAL